MKNLLLIIVLFVFNTMTAQRGYTIYVKANIPIKFQVYIDGELQSYSIGSLYKISYVKPSNAKKLSIHTFTDSHQKPEISLSSSTTTDQYFVINHKPGDNPYLLERVEPYVIAKDQYPTMVAYVPKRVIVKLDSTVKSYQGCTVHDSVITKCIGYIALLKDKKARETLINNTFKYNCLYAAQMKMLGSKMGSDDERIGFYKAFQRRCFDDLIFKTLIETLQSKAKQEEFNKLVNP